MAEHVDRLAEEHPPIPVDSADYSMARPELLAETFGPVLTYMSRVELEVERNVLELNILLPDPPPVDKHFYADVWLPQETHHGLLLDRLQSLAGLPPADPDLTKVKFSYRLLGSLGRWSAVQDVSRMLYYLTGVATEQSAILAYNKLHDGLLELGERAVASTIIAPIRRQEPGHFAYYKIAAQGLWAEMAPWQKWLVRTLRRHTFEPVGAYTKRQWAEFGAVMHHLGITTEGGGGLSRYAQQIGRLERDLLWARKQGLRVPAYVIDSLKSAAKLAAADRVRR
ncbi:MAG TPA: GTP-binding protein LepA [Kribbella sp.]|uniref:GTP-binding protein LepA n=1 Tax=Kribbella sp. TaxID=1871183 RepID=UPI002D7A1A6E|nr:GTP-binding protein LepA [Kribbella sp.]HET6298510.1 GTP-binding protein LepA [Kribbella sp.]